MDRMKWDDPFPHEYPLPNTIWVVLTDGPAGIVLGAYGDRDALRDALATELADMYGEEFADRTGNEPEEMQRWTLGDLLQLADQVEEDSGGDRRLEAYVLPIGRMR